ncbi:MAG: hypothetical protein MJ002_08405 [Paludibacteraceae bacterium]|nr:hypothetical protein [Paludibacteraceae bacterium]
MNKPLKIAGITFASILAVLFIVIAIICNIVFSPSTLTPIIRKHADIFVKCQYSIDEADLTFFSSFPDFAVHVRNVTLVNPFPGAQSDTLLHVADLSASIQIMEFLKNGALVVNHVQLKDGYANVYRENDSINNYSVFDLPESEEEDTTSSIQYCGLNKIILDNINATFVDKELNVNAILKGMDTKLSGEFFLSEEATKGELELAAEKIAVDYGDSTQIFANTENVTLDATWMMELKHIDGEVNVEMPNLLFALNGDTLVRNHDITLNLPADCNLEYMYANLHKGTKVTVDENEIGLKGKVELCDNNDIYTSLSFETNEWDIVKSIALIPDAYRHLVSDYDVTGSFSLKGKVNGTLAEGNYPLLFCDLSLKDCNAKVPQVPYDMRDINADIYADINLNQDCASDVTIRSLTAKADDITADVKGTVKDLLGAMKCNLHVKSHLPLLSLKKVMPKDLRLEMNGVTDIDVKTQFALADVTGLKLNRIHANGTIAYSDLKVGYNDSIHIVDKKGTVGITMPSRHTNKHFKEIGQLSLDGTHLSVDMTGTLNAEAGKPSVKVGFGDILNKNQFIQADCDMTFSTLKGTMDTIAFDVTNPDITATLFPMKNKPKQPGVTASFNCKHLSTRMGNSLVANTSALSLSGFTTFNDLQTNLLMKLNPTLKVNLKEGYVKMAGMELPISIPSIKFDFTPDQLDIDNSRIILGNSDFNLSGEITNIRGYVERNELLKGDLKFRSDKTDVDQIMDLVNGLGNESEATAKTADDGEGDPFIVPKGFDITMNTNISHANFNTKDIRNIRGMLTVKDGVLLAQQMGFTSDAAEMQLTAIYRSQRRNHLFCGLDFHLMKINIHELIELIPAVDTLIPMLKDFQGKAEFHFAGETYLNAKYEPKMSTIRGAAAIEGKDLVVMDNETFSTIAKYLQFQKKTRNVIDSLSVEATVFRNEIDVYPFLVSMDKWQAVLAGRHNLDMSFNYHISLTDCPLPVRLGLDINGTFDKPKFKLVPCKYKALYKPEKQGEMEKNTLRLKKMISDALKANVIETGEE